MTSDQGPNAARKPDRAHIDALRAARDASTPDWHRWAFELRELVLDAYVVGTPDSWMIRAKYCLDREGDEMQAWVDASQAVLDTLPPTER